MEEQNNSNEEESQIMEGDLLNIANNILSLLNYSQKLENEEDLFLDDFYVSIIGNLLSEVQPEIVPGKDIQEKAQIMDQLVKSLSQAIEVDLPHINGAAIILNHDKVSAKNLLDVISELIKTIIDNNLEEVEEEKNDENDKNYSSNKKKSESKNINTEESNKNDELNKKIEEYYDDNINNERNENENEKEKENDFKIKENEEQELDEEIHMSEGTNSLKINNSCFEPLHFEKMMNQIKDKENKVNNSYMRQTYSQNDISRYERNREDAERNQEEYENNIINEQINNNFKEKNEELNNDNIEGEAPIMNVSNISDMNKDKEIENNNMNNTSSKKNKKSNEIPDLIDFSDKKAQEKLKNSSNKKENDIYNYFNKGENNFDLRYNENQGSEVNLDYSENKIANSMPLGDMRLNLEESEEKNKVENGMKKSDSIFDDSHIIKGSQMDKSNRFNEEEEELEQEELEYNNKSSSNKINSRKKSDKKSEKKSKQTSDNKQKTTSKNSSSKKKSEIVQKTDEIKESENKEDNNTNIDKEILPIINDDSFKYQIMKEFHKLYGNKLDYLFLKYNSQLSPNVIELALRNIKLAKDNMLKIGSRYSPKYDPKILEYLQKYEKELQLMLLNYVKERKQHEILKEKKLNNYNKRVKENQKLEEINQLKTQNEIERRQKAKELRDYHRKMKIGNNIYKQALELEKQKNLEKIKSEKEIIDQENEEKRKLMITIEKYYKDQIKMLKEILEKEKKEREREHKEHMILLNKQEREIREEYKKQIKEIFMRFDEEERIEEFESDNNPEIKRIFDAYYGPI